MNEDLIENKNNLSQYECYSEDDLLEDLSSADARNVIINKFKNHTEIILYKKVFFVNSNSNNLVDRKRKFEYDENEELQAKEGVSWNELLNSIPRSRRRSLDNFIGYALSNTWKYFITLTFNPKLIDRSKRSEVNKAWKMFREKLQYRFPDIKILLVSEEHHTDGCLHFHGLLGNCDLKYYLKVAINNQKYLSHFDYSLKQKVFERDVDGNLIPNKYYGHLLKTDYGDQIYNFTNDVFGYGFSSVVILHDEELPGDNDKVVMYLRKYMSKNYNSVGYNKKAYYRTMNLDFKEKIVTKSLDTSTGQILNELVFEDKILKKENDKMCVYTIPNSDVDFSVGNIYSEENSKLKNQFKECKPLSHGTSEFVTANNIFNDVLDIFE